MPRVEFLLLAVSVRNDQPHDLLHMLHTDQVRRGLRVFEEVNQRDI